MKMRGKISSVILRIVMYASAGFTAAALLFILGYILAKVFRIWHHRDCLHGNIHLTMYH